MIIGTGIDIVDMRRLEKTLARFGKKFLLRVYAPEERARASRKTHDGERLATYARRFAAKEACAKALGTGFSQGVFMKDIAVVNDPSGKPSLKLSGGAARRLAALMPQGRTSALHLSLTDEKPYAQAQVIIEAL